jgi:hypothetical protein
MKLAVKVIILNPEDDDTLEEFLATEYRSPGGTIEESLLDIAYDIRDCVEDGGYEISDIHRGD